MMTRLYVAYGNHIPRGKESLRQKKVYTSSPISHDPNVLSNPKVVWQHTFVSPSAFSRRAVVSYWRKYVHEVLVNRLGGLSLPRKSVVRLTDRPDMTLDVYRGRKTTIQQSQSAFNGQPVTTSARIFYSVFGAI